MKKTELHDLWNGIEQQHIKTKDELAQIVETKAQKTVTRFLFVTAVSGVVGAGVIVFLTVTALNRMNDTLYVWNNILLGLITLISLFSAILSWRKLRYNRYYLPVKKWLETDIAMISKSLTGKLSRSYIVVIPVILILLILSINVYFSGKMFTDVLSSEESVTALIVGATVGLFVSFYAERKIRKFHLKNLNELEELYKLTDVPE